jgi:hypothetical protein
LFFAQPARSGRTIASPTPPHPPVPPRAGSRPHHDFFSRCTLASDEAIIREHARRAGVPADRISAVRRLISMYDAGPAS